MQQYGKRRYPTVEVSIVVLDKSDAVRTSGEAGAAWDKEHWGSFENENVWGERGNE